MFNQMTNLDSKTGLINQEHTLYNPDTKNDLTETTSSEVSNTMETAESTEESSTFILYNNVQIKKCIDDFTEDQQIEIFKIIKYYDEYYSSNNNGVFINLDNISNKCKHDIISFINYSKQNNESLQEMESNLDKYKQIIDDSSNENNF
jgi:hypothetical protein